MNTASVTTTQTPTPQSSSGNHTRDAKSIVDDSKDQTGGPNPITAAGQTINYTIVVTNTGNQTQTGINVSDVMPGGGARYLTGPPKASVATPTGRFRNLDLYHQLRSHTGRYRCWRKFGKHSKCYHHAGAWSNHGHGNTPVTQSPSLTIAKTRQEVRPNHSSRSDHQLYHRSNQYGQPNQTGINVSDVMPGGARQEYPDRPTESISSNGQVDVAETGPTPSVTQPHRQT